MEHIIKFIEVVKDLSIKKMVVLFIVFSLLLSIWKIDFILTYIDSKIEKSNTKPNTPTVEDKTRVLSHIDIDIPEPNRIVIEEYTDKYLDPFQNDLAFSSIYKFLPEGDEYLYQGRVLVYLTSRDESLSKLVAKEMNIAWIPLFSGKTIVEQVLDNQPIQIKLDKDSFKYKWTPKSTNIETELVIHSVNLEILKEVSVKFIYYHPISKNNKVIGYIVLYFKNEPDIQRIKEVSSILSARLLPYLLEETK